LLELQQNNETDQITKMRERVFFYAQSKKFMKDYENLAYEKNSEIRQLSNKLAEIQKTNKNLIDNEIHRLKALLCESEARNNEKDQQILKLRNPSLCKLDSNVQEKNMRKMLGSVYHDILTLSKTIGIILNGGEPNMAALLGECTRESKDFSETIDSDTEKIIGIDDLEKLK